MRRKPSFFQRNGLSIFVLGFFLLFWAAQAVTGWQVYNEMRAEESATALGFSAYLATGNFLEVTFENWESEFFQMCLYVFATVWLRQQGSSESKPVEGKSDVDAEPKAHPRAPWPVRRGGWVLALYKQSLALAFLALFLFCFVFHLYGSYKNQVEEAILKGHPADTFVTFLGGPTFWFESFQNWQSEFLAIASIVILSIWLRQHGSPESKPVDMPHEDNP
ncbi:DUF6766 family protein [Asticcacaulis sp. YBE204]|uniref:DUF6766 family protein n=1 Tax=Asticcacaulis sp. YBE204 TaxID=1282363 RepID=UPI0003C3EA81|nr:DUF6766 family protein [Asticcacaulis sp. YBE204]ESQ78735.1 hypothetical protein AEYBE204_12175 [Asticcacaulis sp. YBE204]